MCSNGSTMRTRMHTHVHTCVRFYFISRECVRTDVRVTCEYLFGKHRNKCSNKTLTRTRRTNVRIWGGVLYNAKAFVCGASVPMWYIYSSPAKTAVNTPCLTSKYKLNNRITNTIKYNRSTNQTIQTKSNFNKPTYLI